MDGHAVLEKLPEAEDPKLGLVLATNEELEMIHRQSFFEWGDSLNMEDWLTECDYLMEVPLAKDGGMLCWILSDDQPQSKRLILASCETFQKRIWVNDTQGHLIDAILYGIASVFVEPKYRRRGYAGRLMDELNKQIPKWHVGSNLSYGSTLYSDIRPVYYEKFGWPADVRHSHLEYVPALSKAPRLAEPIRESDLSTLCEVDEKMCREAMTSFPPGKVQIMIGQIEHHALWHIAKEDFACERIFGRRPDAKGAIHGKLGSRIWVIWTHRYYNHPRNKKRNDNVLYILRLVLENPSPKGPEQMDSQVESLKAVLEAARNEAAEWDLQHVKLWHATSHVQDMVTRSGLVCELVEREMDALPCLNWCGPGDYPSNVEWIASEHYAWQ